MGRLRDELADPWGVLLAGVAGGVAGVLPGVGLLIGAGVAAAVYGVKVAAGALLDGEREHSTEKLLSPSPGSAAAIWLGRATAAVRHLRRLADRASGHTDATSAAASRAAGEAEDVLTAMRRLASQCAAVTQALGAASAPGLDREAARLREVSRLRPDDTSAERSAAAVADRIATRDRLAGALQALEGRLQSSALGLEGLVARVAELQATAAAVGRVDPTADDLAALTTEVEGLRMGLADVEQVAQRALGG